MQVCCLDVHCSYGELIEVGDTELHGNKLHSYTKRRSVDVLIAMLEISSDDDARFVFVEVGVGKILGFKKKMHRESSFASFAGF